MRANLVCFLFSLEKTVNACPKQVFRGMEEWDTAHGYTGKAGKRENSMRHGVKTGGKKPARKPFIHKPKLSRQNAVHCAAVAGWAWDIASDAISLAPEWRDILALPAGKKQGETLEYLLGRMRQVDCDLMREICADIREGKQDFLDKAVRMRRFDNTWAWIMLRGKLDPKGDRSGVFTGVGIEVSLLRLDKRFFPPSLDDTQTTYNKLLEHSPNHIIRFDRELFPLYTNPAVRMFVPYEPEELGAKKLAEIDLDQGDLEFVQANVDRVFETGEVIKVRRNVSVGNSKLVGEFSFWPEFDTEGKVRSVLSMQQDLTVEMLREKEAHNNEMRFSTLYRLTQMHEEPEEVVLRFLVEKIVELTGSAHGHLHKLPEETDPGEYIVWSNSHLDVFLEEELASCEPERLRGEFGFDPDSEDEPSRPIVRNKPVPSAQGSFFKGRLPITRYLCAQVIEQGKTVCLASVYNKKTDYAEDDMRQLQLFLNGAALVLHRRRHVQELRKAKESAELANKVKDRFLANVSHELRTPLNGMLSMLQLLEMSHLTPEQVDYARSAATTGQTLLRIISDILDYSKMESGKLELDSNPFDFKNCLISTVHLFRSDAQKKGLALKLSLAGDFPSLVHGDEARVRQILFNLVGNALKFTEQGEIEVFCEVRPAGENMVTVHLSVRDTGIGIPLAMQSKVFRAFTQVDESSTRRHQGSGLGLGIVQLLTRAMHGSVALTSFPGEGTLVECMLPFKAVPEDLAPKGDELEASLPPCPALDVLVAEDDVVSRHAMRLFLEKLGHRPVCVANGRQALEALRLYAFDCLISDVLMPEMDGIEVARHVRAGLADEFVPSEEVRSIVSASIPAEELYIVPRAIPPDIPIVAVSAHAMKGDKEYFLAQGMDYYLSKPAKLKDLAAVLLRVYENRPRAPKLN